LGLGIAAVVAAEGLEEVDDGLPAVEPGVGEYVDSCRSLQQHRTDDQREEVHAR